jgi:hypothetical protein
MRSLIGKSKAKLGYWLIGTGAVVSGSVVAGIALAQTGGNEPPKTSAEAQATIDAMRSAFVANERDFLNKFVRSNQSAASLEREPMEILHQPVPQGLDEAVKQADLVVHGTVRSVEYQLNEQGFVFTEATVAVDKTLKGDAGTSVRVFQSGGPFQAAPGSEPVLTMDPEDPPLFAGDDVYLLLAKMEPGLFSVVDSVGQYHVQGNAIVVPQGVSNPFGSNLSGITTSTFESKVQSALS